MMKAEDLVYAGIPVCVNDYTEALRANAALEWIQRNTTLVFDDSDPDSVKALPASAKLFVVKFNELAGVKQGISSQSIEGLSLSFDNTRTSDILWSLASTLLSGYVKQARVCPARRRW